MNTRKPLMVAGLIAAMSMGSVGIAQASSHSVKSVAKTNTHFASTTMPMIGQVNPLPTVLAALVKAGTITQAQSDAITAAVNAAQAPKPTIAGGTGDGDNDNDGPGHGPMGLGLGFNIKNDTTVITTTLGITAAQLQTSLAAGQSIATIAGAKTAALITALVAAETTSINAKVTAGKLTQAQATTLIAGLTAAVTTAVNAVPAVHTIGGMGMGGFGLGVDIKNDINVITATLGITAAQLQTSLSAHQSLATIAGAKTPALITALVAAETTSINAKVTAGKITQAQATTLIAGLTAAVTAAVNAVPAIPGMGPKGHHGFVGGLGAPSINPGNGPSN